jgi:Tol biopolymer transport system component
LIAFDAGSYLSSTREVWISASDGTGLVNVSKEPTADDRSPNWAPDGKSILFLSNRSGVYQIYRVEADGTKLKNLTQTSTENIDFPLWSPDGAHIAFIRASKAWVMNADGTKAEPVSDRVAGYELAWSPDSKAIVFGTSVPPPSPGINGVGLYVSRIDSDDGARSLDMGSGQMQVHARWSPSQRILWNNIRGDVFTANAETGSVVNVTNDLQHWNTFPVYSHDGEMIIYQTDISGNAELWIVPSSGGTSLPLTHNSIASQKSDHFGDQPYSVSSDGKLVAFSRTHNRDGEQVAEIGVVDIAGLSTQLFSAPNGPLASSPVFAPCKIPSALLAAQ